MPAFFPELYLNKQKQPIHTHSLINCTKKLIFIAAFNSYITLSLFFPITLFTFCSVVYTLSGPNKRSVKRVLTLGVGGNGGGAPSRFFLTSWNCLQPSWCNTVKPKKNGKKKNGKDIKAAEQRHRPPVQMERLS